jgi:hypothetical protein
MAYYQLKFKKILTLWAAAIGTPRGIGTPFAPVAAGRPV